MTKFIEVPGSVKGVRLLRPAPAVHELSPLEKLMALGNSLRVAREPEPTAEVVFPASQGELALEYVSSFDARLPVRRRTPSFQGSFRRQPMGVGRKR